MIAIHGAVFVMLFIFHNILFLFAQYEAFRLQI